MSPQFADSGNSIGLVERFRSTFSTSPEGAIYRFLSNGEGEPVVLTNRDMDRRCRALAAVLQERLAPGDRVLILYPPGLDYVTSFLACLYAGMVAVPASRPNTAMLRKALPRLIGIAENAGLAAILAPESAAEMAAAAESTPPLASLLTLQTNQIDLDAAGLWSTPAVGTGSPALLQYTSGSTGAPKGVVVSHGNLEDNLRRIFDAFQPDPNSDHSVTWLPPYHDMGLIGGMLGPAFSGVPVTFMSPLSFLKRPQRWLEAISACGATISGGPNFAYDLCVSKVGEKDLESLDLSSWRLAFTGAEPVSPHTIGRFAEVFGQCGFRTEAFFPCYGLAEATLLVSGGPWTEKPVVRQVDSEALELGTVQKPEPGGRSRTIVGCGHVVGVDELRIVDPSDRLVLAPGEIGEIWVRGASVAGGYWGRPDETGAVFDARLGHGDRGVGSYLRTGDLGFIDTDGELFITGRLKDVIIVAGRNHYPQDIERTVETSHPCLRADSGVACSMDVDGTEGVLVVHEVDRGWSDVDLDEVETAIRSAVSREHGLRLDEIVLVKRGQIPTTTSGKRRRAACREALRSGELKVITSRRLRSPRSDVSKDHSGSADGERQSDHVDGSSTEPQGLSGLSQSSERDGLERWLVQAVAVQLGLPASEVDPTAPVATFGFQSVEMVGLAGDLEQHLGRSVSPTLTWEYPTIEAIAAHLCSIDEPATAPVVDPSDPTGTRSDPIAIVGIGVRLPGGVAGPEDLWQLLCDGRDAIVEVPSDRWALDDHVSDDPAVPGKTTSRWGGFLDGIDEFDPQFFGISRHEASRMDPQQRLLAEVTWEALEDAGLPVEQLEGSPTGVFVGISTNDYGRHQFADLTRIDAYAGTGNALSIAANRLSYLLDLRGPSLAIDTACSSSLVALHQACRSLHNGECEAAVVGGVNAILSPALSINFSKAGAMAADGRCKAFDARADGYVRSEGAVVLVLKPQTRARLDGDRIYAVIAGSAVNQDGRTNGLMAPNPHAQEAVLRSAYAAADISPVEVDYVEAHGTGTLLGDPIEARAISAVIKGSRTEPCLIGSVKSNLGHLEAAAGLTGLAKTALMIHNRTVVPSLHYRQPNENIPFEELGLQVADSLRPWPADRPALAGVSSFGFGGTNAHVVLREASPAELPPDEASRGDLEPELLVISAKSDAALRDLASRYRRQLPQHSGPDSLRELVSSAAVRRSHHDRRLAVVGSSVSELESGLAAYEDGRLSAGMVSGRRAIGRRPKVAFVFGGQGPRWWPIAHDLLSMPSPFRDVIEGCDQALGRHVPWSLLDELAADPATARLGDPAVAQPALCAVQIAMATQWRAWGIEPQVVVGHSVGEVAAAHASGALDLESALLVALERGRVIRAAIGKGGMAVVGLGFDDAQRAVAGRDPRRVVVAATNGPTATVLAGETSVLKELIDALDSDGVFGRLLESVDFASHSPHMDPLREKLVKSLDGLPTNPVSLPMVSTVTGREVRGSDLDAGYWGDNLREPVRFDPVVTDLVDAGFDTFVEIAPHPMLGGPISQRLAVEERDGIVVGSLRRDESGRGSMLLSLGQLYCAGFPVDWAKVHGGPVKATPLPTYPWQRERCWLDAARSPSSTGDNGHPLLQSVVTAATEPFTTFLSGTLDRNHLTYLRDHCVAGTPVLPASLMLDAMLTAGIEHLANAASPTDVVVKDVHFTALAVLADQSKKPELQLAVVTEDDGGALVTIHVSSPAGQGIWNEVARAELCLAGAGDDSGHNQPSDDQTAARSRCGRPVDVADHYETLRQIGLEYGPSFRGIQEMWSGDGEAVARISPWWELVPDGHGHQLHPAVLDSCLQVLAGATDDVASGTYLPVSVDRFSVMSPSSNPAWAHAVLGEAGDDRRRIEGCSVTIHDRDGRAVAAAEGITLQRLDGALNPDQIMGEAMSELRWTESPGPGSDTEPDPAPGWWLVLSDGAGTGEALCADLSDRGVDCVAVTIGSELRQLSDSRYEVDPAGLDRIGDLTADLADRRGVPLAGVVHCWALDLDLDDDADLAWLSRCELHGPVSLLHMVQAMVDRIAGTPPRLVVLTRGAQKVDDSGDRAPVAAAQASMWGLGRVVANEHAELRPLLIDLDPESPPGETSLVLEEILRSDGTAQLALRGARRYRPALAPLVSDPVPDPDAGPDGQAGRTLPADRYKNSRILAAAPGLLKSLVPTAWKRVTPGPGQVEIEVMAAGLNFADVLKALGVCPGVPSGVVPLGAECVGRVSAVGPGVARWSAGDRVMAIAPSSMAAYTTTDSRLVAPVPNGLDVTAAAAIPIAFLTAILGLERLARTGPGDTVLIHSATGGVGLAALQVARRNGATVLATAGSEEKRELLRELGVEHVMDSRSLDFADQVRALTDGRGVDVVLNSLSGEALRRSLDLLASGGRFVEIGKQDIYQDNRVGLGFLRHNRSVFAVDLERLVSEEPDLIADLYRDVLSGFESGDLRPLPVTEFGYATAPDAFSLMAQARHIGKIVLVPSQDDRVVERSGSVVHGAATYLITGGLGALGLEMAETLVDLGARHLALVGRSGPSSNAREVIAGLRAEGVSVEVRSVDIADFDAVVSLLADLDATMPPVAGVVHAAGVLDDGMLTDLDGDRFQAVTAPKTAGAWNLHRATIERDLDFYILYSSAAGLLGSPGQGAYAAANAFLDGLAHYRAGQGRPALAVDWGPWSDIGLAAGPDRGRLLRTIGIAGIRATDGRAAVERLLAFSRPQICVLPVDQAKLADSASKGLVPDLLLGLSKTTATADGPAQRATIGIRNKLLEIEPGRRRTSLLVEHCRSEAAGVLGIDPETVDPTAPLAMMGFDSLMVLELSKRLESSLGISLSATVAWRFPTIQDLVPFLADCMQVALEPARRAAPVDDQRVDGSSTREGAPSTDPAGPADPVGPSGPDDPVDTSGLDDLTDAEVEQMLLARISRIESGEEV